MSQRSPDNVIDFLQLPKEKRKSQVSLKDALLSVAATHLATSVSTIDVVEQPTQTPSSSNRLPSLRSVVLDELTPLRTPSLRSPRSPPALRSPSFARPVPVAPVPGTGPEHSPTGDQIAAAHSMGRLATSVSGSFVEIERSASPGMPLNNHLQRADGDTRGSRSTMVHTGAAANGGPNRSLYGGLNSSAMAMASVRNSRTLLVQTADEELMRQAAIGRDSSQYSIGAQSTSRSQSQIRSRASTNCGNLEVRVHLEKRTHYTVCIIQYFTSLHVLV